MVVVVAAISVGVGPELLEAFKFRVPLSVVDADPLSSSGFVVE